jgi:hypothetical protein
MKTGTILLLLFLTAFLPLPVLADGVQHDTVSWFYWQKDPSLEIIELRTPNTKVFLNGDGHRTYRVYLQAVHHRDRAGCLCDIEPDSLPQSDPRDMDFRGYADDLWDEVVTNDHIWTHEAGFWRGFAKFNTSGIPDTTVVDSVKLTLYALNCWGAMLGGPHDICSMESNPQYGGGCSIYGDAGNGIIYVNDFDPDPNVLYTWILGDEPTDTACVQLTNQLPDDWFAIGMSDYYGGGWYSNAMGYDRGIGYIEIEEPPTAVNLVSFTAAPDLDQVMIRWQTAYEINNLEWLIERKTEESEYAVIAIIPGQLTKPGPTDYAYTDRAVSPGDAYYYRLVNINTEGERTSHNPVFVNVPKIAGERLLVSPSIFSRQLSIHIMGVYRKQGTLSIVDKTGRIIREIPINGRNSPLDVVWDGRDANGRSVNSGIYYIRLAINGNDAETEKVILIR